MICGEFCWRSYWIPVEASMIHLSRLPSQKMHLSQLSNVFVQNTKCISIVFEVVEFLWKQGQSLGFLHSKFPATNEAVSASDRMTSLWQSGPWYRQQLWRMYQQLLGKQLYQQMYQQLLGKHTLKIFCSEFSATNEAFLWTKRHLWQIAWLSSAIEIFQAIQQAWLELFLNFSTKFCISDNNFGRWQNLWNCWDWWSCWLSGIFLDSCLFHFSSYWEKDCKKYTKYKNYSVMRSRWFNSMYITLLKKLYL